MILVGKKEKDRQLILIPFLKDKFDKDLRECLNKRARDVTPSGKTCVDILSPLLKQMIQDELQMTDPILIAQAARDISDVIVSHLLPTRDLHVAIEFKFKNQPFKIDSKEMIRY
jgi:hypothetical protein